MLMHRVITALVLLAVLIPAMLAATPLPFVVCAWVLLVAAAWEWARLNGQGQAISVGFAAVLALLCLGAYASFWTQAAGGVWLRVWLAVGSAWVLFAAWALRAGAPGWMRLPVALRLALGLLLLFAAWLAVAQARGIGLNFLLSALVLVWVADVGAYAGGKTLSKRFPAKLAPAISPGKTWVGAASGLLAAVLVAALWVLLEGARHPHWGAASLPMRLWQAHPLLLPLGVCAVVGLSIAGDLFESSIKRAAGAKDSSRLLPGHGGVLDRVDALLPTLPFALMLVHVLEQGARL